MATLVSRGHEVIAWAPGDYPEVARELGAMGVGYQAINFDRTSINPLRDLISFIRLLVLLCKAKPDIVLNYTIKPVIYGSLAAKIAGVRSIYSMITGLGYLFIGSSPKQKLLRVVASSLYRLAFLVNKKVFFLNADDRDLFARLNYLNDPEKVILLNGEGVDLDQFDSVKIPAVPPVPLRPVFLLIARLLRDKGILEYIEAARIVKKKYDRVVFRLVGPFDSNPTAIKQEDIQNWQQEGLIEYLGETADVRPYLSECSVYVLPSYREGMPRTVLEAMAMGKPIVTTDVPGCRETVTDGENGFLVPAQDARALAVALEKFVVNPVLTVEMGTRSRRIAEEKFDVHKVNDMIMRTMGLSDEKGV